MALESLKLLEAKIGVFLARHEQLSNEKESLRTRLREQERAYAMLLEQVQQYEKEREEIRSRLEKIIGCFKGLDL
jgi:uncharacterized coiled-coil DUF342 family protein